MKELNDGTKVSARSWYYLLDWNDRDNWSFMTSEFDKMKLHELTGDEYKILFTKATSEEVFSK